MNFALVLKEVLWCLATEGAMSYRRIKRSFDLDDDALEDLRRELIGTLRLAADRGGELLVWAPDGRPARADLAAPSHPSLPALRQSAVSPTLAA
jgi:hypothetical protein